MCIESIEERAIRVNVNVNVMAECEQTANSVQVDHEGLRGPLVRARVVRSLGPTDRLRLARRSAAARRRDLHLPTGQFAARQNRARRRGTFFLQFNSFNVSFLYNLLLSTIRTLPHFNTYRPIGIP